MPWSWSSCSRSARTAWQSWPGATSTCADAAGIPDVISQMCRSWTSATCGRAAMAAPMSAGVTPTGAASRKTRPESRIRPAPAVSMRATTTSEAMASARANPVSTMTTPATAVAAKA